MLLRHQDTEDGYFSFDIFHSFCKNFHKIERLWIPELRKFRLTPSLFLADLSMGTLAGVEMSVKKVICLHDKDQ